MYEIEEEIQEKLDSRPCPFKFSSCQPTGPVIIILLFCVRPLNNGRKYLRL